MYSHLKIHIVYFLPSSLMETPKLNLYCRIQMIRLCSIRGAHFFAKVQHSDPRDKTKKLPFYFFILYVYLLYFFGFVVRKLLGWKKKKEKETYVTHIYNLFISMTLICSRHLSSVSSIISCGLRNYEKNLHSTSSLEYLHYGQIRQKILQLQRKVSWNWRQNVDNKMKLPIK